MNAQRALATALLACATLGTCAAAAGEERWYRVQVDGATAGYEHEVSGTTADGLTETHHEMHIALDRLGTPIAIGEDDLIVEDAAGHPLSMQATLRQSNEDTRIELAVQPDGLRVTQAAAGRRYERSLPPAPDLLGPTGVRLRTRAWLAAPGEPLSYRVFAPELAATAWVTRRLVGRDAAGHALVEERMDGSPDASRLVLDAEGQTLGESEDSPFGRVELVPGDATVAAVEARGARVRPEAYARTLLRTNVRLPNPRRLERLRVAIHLDDPSVGWPDLEGPGQHVLAASAAHRVLELTHIAAPGEASGAAAPDDPDLQPNVLLQSDHPDIVALAATLRRPGAGALEQAFEVRDWVATHLTFDLGLAVAPAGEIVRDRRGTCVAYAVLTASLARALGIPARVALGYVYLDGVFGGHAWTEVRIGASWVPIDAAVWSPGVADPARITLARHGGEAGIGSGALELARLLGRISVRIEGYTLEGRARRVPADAAPYRIVGRLYHNPWLGLALEAPAGYRYAGLDAVYPDPALLRLEGPDGARITLSTEPLAPGGPAPGLPGATRCESGPEGRRCVRPVGGTAWVLTATPGAASRRLEEVLRSLRVRP